MGMNDVKMETSSYTHADRLTKKFFELRQKFQLNDKCWRMHVKPYSKAGVRELEDLRKLPYAIDRVTITEQNGTYCITSRQPIATMSDYIESLWGMLHRKFERQSKELVCEELVGMSGFKRPLKWHENDLGLPVAEVDSEKNFYLFILSPEFIEANALPHFRMAG